MAARPWGSRLGSAGSGQSTTVAPLCASSPRYEEVPSHDFHFSSSFISLHLLHLLLPFSTDVDAEEEAEIRRNRNYNNNNKKKRKEKRKRFPTSDSHSTVLGPWFRKKRKKIKKKECRPKKTKQRCVASRRSSFVLFGVHAKHEPGEIHAEFRQKKIE